MNHAVHSPRNSHNAIEVAIDLIFLQRIYPGRFGISALFDDLAGRALYAGLIVSRRSVIAMRRQRQGLWQMAVLSDPPGTVYNCVFLTEHYHSCQESNQVTKLTGILCGHRRDRDFLPVR